MTVIAAPRIERLLDLRRRIHRVVDFIDEHLDADLSLDHLAEIACISPFHFHRLYSQMVGQSPADSVRRLRLLRATDGILTQRLNVTQAAAMARYGSPQAFARAFRREFGRSAREMRAASRVEASPRDVTEFTIVHRPTLEMDAVLHDGVRSAADVLAIDVQTYNFVLGAKDSAGTAVYFDDLLTPFDQRFRCALCFEAKDRERLPRHAELQRLEIPGGRYARLEQRGRLLDLTPHWLRFVGQVLPKAGWVQRPGPVLRELVSDRATTPPSQRLSHLYVPVERLVSH